RTPHRRARARAARYRAGAPDAARSAPAAIRSQTKRRASGFDHSSFAHLFQLPTHVGARRVTEFILIHLGAERARAFELFLQEATAPGGKGAVIVGAELT